MMKSLWFVVPQNKGTFKGLGGRGKKRVREERRENLSDFSLPAHESPSPPPPDSWGLCSGASLIYGGTARHLLQHLTPPGKERSSPLPPRLARN